MTKKRRGFTLIETVTTLFIVSLLAMLIMPNIANVQQTANKRQAEAMVHMIQGQVALYQEEKHEKLVSYNELISAGYLTDAQVQAAEAAKIRLQNGQVVQSTTK
ncbi:prepilin-type N-terminal cleavage/methylation domain-containing protein [Weissella ceti]|uniref:Prepilin-type N-terminal cleavage/methylation domain-containing protein n=1 Tax=Weissella ceti TaxID=759620 RepID=A0ABT3E2N9_9LACO|nr:prepilin-type N-terminal cleavage/methylation domain-containing protein [Weissella ceti]MCW0952684.1 prepilin-type N-terminal cleavage/methylation domain-containing protein [Weissella ceti]QVK12386.1 prepilin-type N-terminal cleavage/methylation domain-containing protein [Weissella ceti]